MQADLSGGIYGESTGTGNLRGRTERSPDRQNPRVKVVGQFQAPSPDASRLSGTYFREGRFTGRNPGKRPVCPRLPYGKTDIAIRTEEAPVQDYGASSTCRSLGAFESGRI